MGEGNSMQATKKLKNFSHRNRQSENEKASARAAGCCV